MNIVWVTPQWRGHTLIWPQNCEVIVQTLHSTRICADSAKLLVDGQPMCIRHAKIKALWALAGPPPDLTLKEVPRETAP